MPRELEKTYDPKKVEERIYRQWERSGFFNPDALRGRGSGAKGRRSPVGKPFTIIMPPPNANGPLHIGHAVFVTLQDIMTRFARMRGRNTLWLPGADHAGFETQVVFDKKLEKEGRSRFAIRRDELWREMWEFTMENKKAMEGQLRKLGASCDWSREKFTLDPDIMKIVNDTFVKLHQDGLVYRGERIVNWCVTHQTTLSDLEVKHEERQDPLYYIKYGPLELATVRPETKFGDTAVAVHPSDKRYQKYIGKELEIETLLGPAKIKVIADEAVDPKFGTGVIKVTPAHDPVDFEIGKRHSLEVRSVIGKDGKLNEKTGPYAGLKVAEARKKVAEDMEKAGLLEKVDPNYKHSVAVCYKCGTVVEPLVMPQWFIKMKPLAEPAIKAVEQRKIAFVPDHFKKIYLHWLRNIRDWNISRQIVWGIRIPVWYCKGMRREGEKIMGFAGDIVSQVFAGKVRTYRLRDHELKVGDRVLFENSATETIFGYGIITGAKQTTVGGIELPDPLHGGKYHTPAELIAALKRHYPQKPVVRDTPVWIYTFEFRRDPSFSGCDDAIISVTPPARCPKCRAVNLVQDPDTFDTWFSSGQWPYATLGYPKGKDYKIFYPTDVMETGHDILFFWVARMVMLGLYRTGKIPFKTVYLHGLVRDKDRQKMSKSKGNVIDPLGVAELYGTDAVRMALVVGNLPGQDIIISEEKIRGYRNFANKLWNIHRFIMFNAEGRRTKAKIMHSAEDKKRLHELSTLVKRVTTDLERFRFHHAAETLYHYIWHTFADKIIESAKPRLASADPKERARVQSLLLEIHSTLLKLLHPFMPFITEELWSHLPDRQAGLPLPKKSLLLVTPWPR